MSCGWLTCPGVRDGMGLFNRSKMVGIQGIYNFTTGPGGHKGPKGSQGSQGVTRVPGGHTRVPGGHKGPKGQWGSMGVPRGSQGVPRGPRWLNFLPAARQETLTPELNL